MTRLIEMLPIAGRLLLLISSALAAVQEPLTDAHSKSVSESQWSFNYSSEAPHYFASAYGLLQQWSNTFFHNGHSIVPCEIAPLTKLYHGRRDGEVPPSPEWVAFDIGMSYGIMGGTQDSHMLTYQTTRKVKCLYFDGESATLFGTGQLQTQMLHIWGNVSGPGRSDNGFRGLWEEYARATGLCDWIGESNLGGLGWGYEGVVRMNAGFEMIWCNFSSPSIRLISHLNVSAPLLAEPDQEDILVDTVTDVDPTSYYPLPPSPTRSDKATDPSDPARPPPMGGSNDREPFWTSRAWTWYYSAAAHYGSSGNGPGIGETRVKPVTCGFLSYYSPNFLSEALPRAREEQKSLNLTASGMWSGPGATGSRSKALEALTRRRRYHTLDQISVSDAARFKAHSERVLRDLLSESPSTCSGIDWLTMTNDIVQSYAQPLLVFSKVLKMYENVTSSNHTMTRNWMKEVRDQTHVFLLPFLEYPKGEDDGTVWERGSNLYKETHSKCQFQYTRLLAPEEGFTLGPEETALKLAVEAVTGGICSTLVDIGLAVEGIWESSFNTPGSKSRADPLETLTPEVTRWKHGVEELMAWLGWAGEWTGCKEKCAWDESCFIPMWPMIPMAGGPGRGRGPGGGGRGPPGYGGRYGKPGYPGPGFAPNQTAPGRPIGGGPGGGPGRGFNPWGDESDLWEPKCVKSDYIMNGRR